MRDIVISFIVGVSLGTFGGCLVLLLLPEGRMAVAIYLASIILWGLLGACAGSLLALGKLLTTR